MPPRRPRKGKEKKNEEEKEKEKEEDKEKDEGESEALCWSLKLSPNRQPLNHPTLRKDVPPDRFSPDPTTEFR
jgi:hypothetical protein